MREFAAIVPVSAEKGWQLDDLLREIRQPSARRRRRCIADDDLTDRDERFLAAEYIREKIFRLLGDEVPYATTVVIDTSSTTAQLRRIHATVYVDKDEPARHAARRRRRAHEKHRQRRRAATWSGSSAARSFSRSGSR